MNRLWNLSSYGGVVVLCGGGGHDNVPVIGTQARGKEICGYRGHPMSCIASVTDIDDLIDHQHINHYILFRWIDCWIYHHIIYE